MQLLFFKKRFCAWVKILQGGSENNLIILQGGMMGNNLLWNCNELNDNDIDIIIRNIGNSEKLIRTMQMNRS